MLVTLKQLLDGIRQKDCAIPAFNIFGYEDAISVVRAAEAMNAPVILATNRVALQHMPIQYFGRLLTAIAADARVPVCVHLDHGKDYDTVAQAIMNGYSSVMYDGSQLPLEENIRNTQEVVKLARACGVSVEAEVGSVGYTDQDVKSFYTEPEEAKRFAEETEVDALAVAIGTVHRMQTQTASIQFDRLQAIQDVIDTPIVIHGSTGIPDDDLAKLVTYNVGKINIGTALRMAFGKTLRQEMEARPGEFDRIALFQEPMRQVEEAAKQKMAILKPWKYFS